MGKYKHIDNAEFLEKQLKNIVKEVQEIEDPHIITEYKQFFKEHVSLFRRNFVAAYIIKKFLHDNATHTTKKQRKYIPPPDRSFNKKYNNTEPQQKHRKVILKNISQHQCTKEELLTFLSSIDGVEKKDITHITLQETKTLVSIAQPALKALTKGIKNKPFKNKKIYYSY